MKSSFLLLSRPALIGLADALESGRLKLPISESYLTRYIPAASLSALATELNRLYQAGFTAMQVAYTLRLVAAEREAAQSQRDRVDLVWTGQEVIGTESRDTWVVVQELFSSVKYSVLLSSYALDKGKKARELFQALAIRMDERPELQVRMFLNVQRPHGSQESEAVLLRKFAEIFRNEIWCGNKLPEVFHDPRSLSTESGPKACLHAKCIVVDEARLLITSANFTEAAHERNIEAGVLFTDSVAARAIRTQFETLVSRQVLQRAPGI
jgi:phosphatidylserine/phosphatidylglycerophosphate/cardiolipin synthase-like enzyme